MSSPTFSRLFDNIHQHKGEQRKQPENTADFQRRRSSRCVVLLRTGDEEEQLLPSENEEIKEEGLVKWHVYTEYIRAGVGLSFGLIWLLSVLSIREALMIFASWWLAAWSEDKGHRYYHLKNCTKTKDIKINTINSMNDVEWTNHENRRFYFYCGLSSFCRFWMSILIYFLF